MTNLQTGTVRRQKKSILWKFLRNRLAISVFKAILTTNTSVDSVSMPVDSVARVNRLTIEGSLISLKFYPSSRDSLIAFEEVSHQSQSKHTDMMGIYDFHSSSALAIQDRILRYGSEDSELPSARVYRGPSTVCTSNSVECIASAPAPIIIADDAPCLHRPASGVKNGNKHTQGKKSCSTGSNAQQPPQSNGIYPGLKSDARSSDYKCGLAKAGFHHAEKARRSSNNPDTHDCRIRHRCRMQIIGELLP